MYLKDGIIFVTLIRFIQIQYQKSEHKTEKGFINVFEKIMLDYGFALRNKYFTFAVSIARS